MWSSSVFALSKEWCLFLTVRNSGVVFPHGCRPKWSHHKAVLSIGKAAADAGNSGEGRLLPHSSTVRSTCRDFCPRCHRRDLHRGWRRRNEQPLAQTVQRCLFFSLPAAHCEPVFKASVEYPNSPHTKPQLKAKAFTHVLLFSLQRLSPAHSH